MIQARLRNCMRVLHMAWIYAMKGRKIDNSENIPLNIGSKTQLWNKIMKEVKAKRVARPFDTIPFDNYIQSPIGLVPKKGSDKLRLIFHLSYDFSQECNGKSLNYHTPKEKCAVKYNDLDYAVYACLRMKRHQRHKLHKLAKKIKREHKQMDNSGDLQPIYMGKTDVQSAFRLVPLLKRCWPWLIMKAENPLMKQIQYFVDKCLPFSASISCALFQMISDALRCIIKFRTRTYKTITNYLDDFLFIAYMLARCNYLIKKFLQLCEEVGVLISQEKTEWGSTRIIFLGILLDGYWMILFIPEQKKSRAIDMLHTLINKKKVTVKELLSYVAIWTSWTGPYIQVEFSPEECMLNIHQWSKSIIGSLMKPTDKIWPANSNGDNIIM